MSRINETYLNSRNSYHQKTSYSMRNNKHYGSHHQKKHQEGDPLTWHEGFQIRILICVILFAAFAIMDGKLISKTQQQFLYQRLEEPMSRQTAETWTHLISPK